MALVITTASPLPPAVVGVAYTTPMTVTGATAPLVWSISVGSLPSGLVINPVTGVVAGTPLIAGTSNFTVNVVDALLQSTSAPIQMVTAGIFIPNALSVVRSLRFGL